AACRTLEIVVRKALFDLIDRDHLDFEPEALGHRGTALQFLEPSVIERDRDRAVLLEAGCLPGLFLEPLEESGRVFGKLGQVAGGAELPDEPRRMPCGA